MFTCICSICNLIFKSTTPEHLCDGGRDLKVETPTRQGDDSDALQKDLFLEA